MTIDNIDTLPDEALLDIFSFYLVEGSMHWHIDPWLPLVHVCRRWRYIIFGSPRRLKIRVLYTPKTRIEVTLDIWPNLPIQVSFHVYRGSGWQSENNLIAALGHTDRICQIQLDGPCAALEPILPALQKSFPVLTSLDIRSSDPFHPEAMLVLPQASLGGCAAHLRSCNLWGVDFPGIWRLLLTANHLVTLSLWEIPHSKYASPQEMTTNLSEMPNLESLSIGFKSPQSLHNWPDQPNRLLSPFTPVVLPSLTKFQFRVMSEYVEDFVSRIDAPLLDKIDITFFDQPVFNTPRLHDFLARIGNFKAASRGGVVFCCSSIEFEFELGSLSLKLRILCGGLGRQVSTMAQLCGSSSHFSTLKRLDISNALLAELQYLRDGVEIIQWLESLRPFTSLKDLHLKPLLGARYAFALRELAQERVTEVLPALQNLFLQELEPFGPIQEAVGQFVAARQLSGLPVAVHSWDGWS